MNKRLRNMIISLAVLGLLVITSPAFAQSPEPVAKPASTANPNLAASCGLDLILVLDESGSISTTNTALVRTGALAFANALANTGSRMAVVEFSSLARRPFNYTLVTSGWITSSFTPYINATAGGDYTNRYNPLEAAPGGNLTNWDDALEEAMLINGTAVAPLVVFVTDGVPNAYNADALGEAGGIGSISANQSLWRAIIEANSVKSQGSHILGVGVALSVTGLLNLQDVAGTEIAPPAVFNIATTDIISAGDFNALATQLATIVTELCASSVNISKLVDEGDGHGPMPGAGWQFTTNIQIQSGGTYTWVTPLPASPQGARSATTNEKGAATFQWKPSGNFSSRATIIETLKPGYEFQSVTCELRRPDNLQPIVQINPSVTLSPGQVTLTMPTSPLIGPKDSLSCVVTNVATKPKLTLVKVVDGGSAQPDDFKLTVGGLPVQSGVANTLLTTTPYAIGETQLPNYEFVSITGHQKCPDVLNGTIMLSAGDDITCTITNRFTGPTTGDLTVIKLVDGGAAQPGDFNIKVTVGGVEQPNFPGENSGTTLTGLPNGAAYSVEETNPGNYVPEYSAGCTGTIVTGQPQTCTITNRLPPTGGLTVIKNVNGGPAIPGNFNIKVNIDGTEQEFPGAGNPGTTLTGLANGAAYSVVETNPGDYLPSYDAGCVGTIVGGQTQTCTITNTYNPQNGTLTVKKVVVGGSLQPGDFQLQVTIGGGTPVNFPGKAEGEVFNGANGLSFNVTEPAPGTDYTVVYQNCSGTFVVGQNQECIVTNTYNPPPPPPPTCTPLDRDPKAHLTGTIIVQGDMLVGTVTNSSTLCEYEVGMAAYEKPDNNLAHQILFSWDPGAVDPASFTGGNGQPAYPGQSKVVGPNSSITLMVQMPTCATQVDIFFDANYLSTYGLTDLDIVPLVLPNFHTNLYGPNGNKYDTRLIVAQHFGGNNFCVPAPNP